MLEMNEESSPAIKSNDHIVDELQLQLTDVGRQLGHNDDVKWCHFSVAANAPTQATTEAYLSRFSKASLLLFCVT